MTEQTHRPILALALAALIAATPALGQDAEEDAEGDASVGAEAQTEEAPAAGAGEDEAGSAAAGLATGEPVPPANRGPAIYVREEHGAFEVRCLEAPEGQTDPCQLFQRLSDQNGNPTADVNVFDLPDGDEVVAGATILTPLQTLLTAQVTMTIDNGQARRYPFAFCDTTGCYARMGLTAEDVNRLRRGAKATVVVVPAQAPDQRVELEMSLAGFTAGFAAIEVPNR